MNFFLLIGLALFVGFQAAKSSQRVKVPQVVGYILAGVILGNSFLNIISIETTERLQIISNLALSLIGFIIGGELSRHNLKGLKRNILVISILEASGAFILVFLSIYLFTNSLPIALIFGALASATAPAATVDVLWEYNAKGPLTTTLFAVVGVDDAIAIIIFGFASSITRVLLIGKKSLTFSDVLVGPTAEILSALITGIIMALILNFFLKRLSNPSEILILTLGLVLLGTGIASRYNFSLILTNMFLGITLINITERNRMVFENISRITPPIYLIFFILVGTRLQLSYLLTLGILGLIYVLMRIAGKSIGAYVGAYFSKAPGVVRKYLGICLLSQAGVAIGLAIEALHSFSSISNQGAILGLMAINIIAGSTFIFQVLGPPLTKMAIFKAGESESQRPA